MLRWIGQLLFSSRWFLTSLVAAIMIPGAALAVLSHFAVELSSEDQLEVAAVAVRNYVDENPPRQGWKATGYKILPGKGILVTVNIPYYAHAKVIRGRRERIKYSYLKLACPPPNAWVYEWLGDSRIFIDLQHYGETLIQAPCPKPGKSGIFF